MTNDSPVDVRQNHWMHLRIHNNGGFVRFHFRHPLPFIPCFSLGVIGLSCVSGLRAVERQGDGFSDNWHNGCASKRLSVAFEEPPLDN
jgi:hypothetical protein